MGRGGGGLIPFATDHIWRSVWSLWIPEHPRFWPGDGLMLGRCRRWRPSIKPSLGEWLVFATPGHAHFSNDVRHELTFFNMIDIYFGTFSSPRPRVYSRYTTLEALIWSILPAISRSLNKSWTSYNAEIFSFKPWGPIWIAKRGTNAPTLSNDFQHVQWSLRTLHILIWLQTPTFLTVRRLSCMWRLHDATASGWDSLTLYWKGGKPDVFRRKLLSGRSMA